MQSSTLLEWFLLGLVSYVRGPLLDTADSPLITSVNHDGFKII